MAVTVAGLAPAALAMSIRAIRPAARIVSSTCLRPPSRWSAELDTLRDFAKTRPPFAPVSGPVEPGRARPRVTIRDLI
ncbi:hypothetical protein GCM10011534_25940 [Pseudooceanicola nanhaiensis]|uniref:Uncharacterized protein n=1 Tax=Pseudooceanicola nanhaiensis TaxID=375761 RepID=A0A917WH47_9RHOB|nr:hypothetical protein GCM10011534_25940 [Pseudooceanicola nanhaiensis]